MDRFDGLFMTVTQQSGGLDNLFEALFGFLHRKSDFFSAATPEQAKAVVDKAFNKYALLAEEKKIEDKKRRDVIDAERKRKAEAAAKAESDATTKKAAAAVQTSLATQPKIIEITEEEEEQTKHDQTTKTAAVVVETKEQEPVVVDDEDGPAPEGNGGRTDKYVWNQTLQQVELNFSLPTKVTSRDVKVTFSKDKLKVAVSGEVLVDGQLHEKVLPDDCMWTIVDGNHLVVTLDKVNQMNWWDCVMVGDSAIDVKRIVPESSKLSDLDGETRATVEKMLFDQRQKQMGLPSSDQLKQHEIFEKFKKAHPELDFSNAKINYGGEQGGLGGMMGGM